MNTSESASTGHSPFFLEHGRQPRDIASRAMDTSEMPALSAQLAEVMQDRLGLARRIQSAVETHAEDDQARHAALSREAQPQAAFATIKRNDLRGPRPMA